LVISSFQKNNLPALLAKNTKAIAQLKALKSIPEAANKII
jgi:hypothetical protein